MCQPIVTILLLLVFLGVFFGLVDAQDLVAGLDYGSFQGAYSVANNISYWKKIPYAAPPVGENRFRGPQVPIPITNGTYNSSQTFDMCPQRTVNGSEDCLYLGLYSRPWTKLQSLRPVVVVFHGGGFVQGSAYFSTMPPSAYPILNVSSESDVVFVYPNYRLNAFGFLSGREVAEDSNSDLNVGLLDQDMAIRWTRRYIGVFGGDPERVSIWGQSAGGGSVIAHVIASKRNQDEDERPLFHQALASSPFWPKTYSNTDPEAQWRYDALVNLTGCAANPDSLACLKRVDVQTIRNASLAIAGSHTYTTSSFTWGPVIDGAFLTRPLSEIPAIDINIRLGVSMYNTHEGENFVPPGFKNATDAGDPPFNSSVDSFEGWIRGYLPAFADENIEELKRLYPETGSTDTLKRYDDTYTRAGLVYRDSVLACPAYWMAGAASEEAWLGEYTMPPAQHASDVHWWNTVNTAQETDSLHYKGYTGALASFFMTGDPNALKLTPEHVPGVPSLLETDTQFVVTEDGFATSKLVQFKKRCEFWRQVAPRVPI